MADSWDNYKMHLSIERSIRMDSLARVVTCCNHFTQKPFFPHLPTTDLLFTRFPTKFLKRLPGKKKKTRALNLLDLWQNKDSKEGPHFRNGNLTCKEVFHLSQHDRTEQTPLSSCLSRDSHPIHRLPLKGTFFL